MLRAKSMTALILASLLSAVMARAAEAQVTAIKCGRLIDVEKGTVVHNAVVLVEGTRIRAVGADVAIPAGARVVDLGQATVLPGLIDAHTHLLTRFPPRLDHDQESAMVEYTQMDTAKRALLGAAQAREMLEAGFTTVRDVGNSGVNGDLALRDAIREGWVPGPRMLVSTRALSPIGGQFFWLSGPGKELVRQEFVEVTGPEEARRAVRHAVFDGADFIKVIVHSVVTFSPEEMQAIVDEAHRQGRKVAAHATGDAGTRLAAQAGVDSIEHAFEVPDDVLRLMAEKKIFLVPTDLPLDDLLSFPAPPGETAEQAEQRRAADEAYVEQHRERLARALRLGVPVAAGSDSYYAVPGKTRGQASLGMFRAMAAAGMKPLEILQAATIRAAELLGFPERFGSLSPGKSADLIAVPGNPLDDITALEDVRFVMKTGRIAKDEITGR